MSDAFQNDPLQEAQRAYSPLPMMINRWRQMTAGGPAPAPPSLERQPQQDNPPPSQSQPPDMMRQWANNYLPPGSPYPRQRGFQPFQRASIPRPAHQWGSEEPFPALPQPFETPALAQGLSHWFGQNGSPNVSSIAMMMGPYAGDFLQGVQQGQQERAKNAMEQLRFRTAQLVEQQQEEAFRYRDVLAAHGALNQTTDPAKMLKPVNGKTVMEDLYDTARDIGDLGKPGSLGDLIASGAMPSDVVKFLQARDNQLTNAQKLKATLGETAQEDARLGLTPSSQAQPDSGAAADVAKYTGLEEPGGVTPPPVATGASAPAAAAPAKPDQTLVPGPDGNMVPASSAGTGADTGGITPIDAMKHSIMSGKEPPAAWAKTHPKAYNEAIDRALEANATLDRIVKNPPKDVSKILPMVRALNPDLAKDVELVGNYQDPASGGVSGTGGSPGTPSGQYSNRLRQLVTLIDPTWNQGNYQQQQLFRHDHAAQTMLARTQDFSPMATQLAGDLRVVQDKLRKQGISPDSVNIMGLVDRFKDDTDYVRLRSDLLAYNNAYNVLVTAGHNTVTGVKMQEEGLDPWAPISTYRGVMQGHAVGASGMVRAMERRWATAGGKPESMLVGAEEDFKNIRDISRWDTISGAMPYDPANKDNDIIIKKAGVWGPAGQYYWTGVFPQSRDDPRNWKRVQ